MIFPFSTPTQLWLEIQPDIQTESWQQSQHCQHFSAPSSCWRAYLNHICYQVFLPWIREEYVPKAAVWPQKAQLPSIWEFVNGTAIAIGKKRLVLLPTEVIDEDELRVPQEWIDIPGWAGDYYLAVQVNLQEEWVRLWGYTTHQHLKTQGRYDARDRSYCLDGDDLIRDMKVLWVAQQLCPDEPTREAVAALPALPEVQVENLVQRLGNPAVIFPRLAVPFTLWGALLENENWRQRLYHQRLGEATPERVLVNLSRWLENVFEAGWQSLDALFPASQGGDLAFSYIGVRGAEGFRESQVYRVKVLNLGNQAGETVVLLIGLAAEADERVAVRVQLHPQPGNRYLPPQSRLILRAESGDVLQSVESGSEDNYIQIPRFRCAPGFRFSMQVGLKNVEMTEDFIV